MSEPTSVVPLTLTPHTPDATDRPKSRKELRMEKKKQQQKTTTTTTETTTTTTAAPLTGHNNNNNNKNTTQEDPQLTRKERKRLQEREERRRQRKESKVAKEHAQEERIFRQKENDRQKQQQQQQEAPPSSSSGKRKRGQEQPPLPLSNNNTKNAKKEVSKNSKKQLKKQKNKLKKVSAIHKSEAELVQMENVYDTLFQETDTTTGFTTCERGVQYKDLVVGGELGGKNKNTAAAVVTHNSLCHVKYKLTAYRKAPAMKVTLDQSKSFRFRVGKGEVIQGWDIGMMGMHVGGRRQLVIPPKAGYGSKDIGAGSGATLYFDITLLSC